MIAKVQVKADVRSQLYWEYTRPAYRIDIIRKELYI